MTPEIGETIPSWDELRTAFHVARVGTVSGAAEALGVHHATVIRHVDALEGRLGVKLFQRHARGYTPTEAGQDLLEVGQSTDDRLTQFAARMRGQGTGMTGDLVVTSLPLLSPMLSPVLTEFQRAWPELVVRYLASDAVFRLEYGEAHVAVRAGSAPDEPDNVVQRFGTLPMALYAAADYIERHGRPADASDLAGHRFVSYDNIESRAPFQRWLRDCVAPEAIVFRGNADFIVFDAVRAGAGLGFLPVWEAERIAGLTEVLPPRADWSAPLWLVTHVDLHRTTKVQTFLTALKAAAARWPKELAPGSAVEATSTPRGASK